MQGNFYNDAVIDPYMLERAESMRGPVSVLYGKSSPGGYLRYGQQASDHRTAERSSV
ncbi:TonB-dependent receptor plug domain-containing protein [Escherichia coli]